MPGSCPVFLQRLSSPSFEIRRFLRIVPNCQYEGFRSTPGPRRPGCRRSGPSNDRERPQWWLQAGYLHLRPRLDGTGQYGSWTVPTCHTATTNRRTQGITVGPATCSALKRGGGVACQGVGGAYKAGIMDNVSALGTTQAAINEAKNMFSKAAQKCPNAKIVFGGYRYGPTVSPCHQARKLTGTQPRRCRHARCGLHAPVKCQVEGRWWCPVRRHPQPRRQGTDSQLP